MAKYDSINELVYKDFDTRMKPICIGRISDTKFHSEVGKKGRQVM